MTAHANKPTRQSQDRAHPSLEAHGFRVVGVGRRPFRANHHPTHFVGAGQMKILGIDPGLFGAAVIIEIGNAAAPQLAAATDIPLTGIKAKQRVDVIALRDWIVQHAPQHCFVERAQAMPRQGSSSGFKYGRAIGSIEAVVVCTGIPMTIIEPALWKKFHGCCRDKESGRQRAMQLFPGAHAELARKKDHGRGDAMLLALYGAQRHLRGDAS